MLDLDVRKKVAEISKLNVEKWKTVFSLVVGAASAVGVAAIFIYCFFIAHFFPTGLEVGDTLFFVFATLGLSLTGIVLSGFGIMPYLPWINRHTDAKKTIWSPDWLCDSDAKIKMTRNWLLLGFALSVLILTISVRTLSFKWFGLPVKHSCEILLAYIFGSLALTFYIISACVLCGGLGDLFISIASGLIFSAITGLLAIFFPSTGSASFFVVGLLLAGLSMAIGVDMLSVPIPKNDEDLEANRRSRIAASILIFLGILIPYIACGIDAKMLNYVFKGLGVYSDHSTLIVNKSEFGKLQTVADSKGIRLYSCRMDDENTAISDVRIWWYGIGERSYVEIGAYTDAAENTTQRTLSARVDLDSAGVRKSESQINTSCIELRRGIYFDSFKTKLTDKQWELAEPIIREFFKAKKKEDNIIVVGYADPRPSSTKSNFSLAHDRACNIYNKLNEAKLTAGGNVLIDIRGDMEGISACSSKEGAARESACEERNRRVELRLIGSSGEKVVRSATANATEACK